MKPQVAKSIKLFLTELKNRIELLSGNKVTENIDNSNIDEINDILNQYNILPKDEIKPHDLKKVSEEDIKRLLSLSGQNEYSIDYIISKLDEQYENVATTINKYISDFIRIGSSQAEMFNVKINLYQKYIALFEQEELEEPFDDINEISRVMSEVGLPDEDKWRILAHIASQNNKVIRAGDFNLGIRIANEYEKIEEYLSDEKVVAILKNRLEKDEIDIETIPTIASELSPSTHIREDIMANIISILIARNLLDKLELIIHEEDRQEMIEIIELVLSNIMVLDDKAVYEAEDIKNARLDFYYNSIENGITEEMIKEYMDLPLSELEAKDISREYAVDLKELSILKPIIETLDTLDALEKDSSEYQKAINVLKKLIEQYRILEEKKVNLDQRIN